MHFVVLMFHESSFANLKRLVFIKIDGVNLQKLMDMIYIHSVIDVFLLSVFLSFVFP